MIDNFSDDYWWPLALSSELPQDKILARTLFGLPLVLFRAQNNTASVLIDRCPHRFAPLSKGRIISGELECPYHGWRFNGQGHCTQVPGLAMECSAQSVVRQLNACEVHGFVWVNTRKAALAVLPDGRLPDASVDSFYMVDSINATIAEVAENFLDGSHTHFVHAGWIRCNSRRQNISATVTTFSEGIEVIYSGEKNQNGFISRLFEVDRGISISRFYLPGLAEIEYRDKAGRLSLLASLWLVPAESDDNLRVFIRINTAKNRVPAWLKTFFMRRLFGVIFRQDKKILELVRNNIHAFDRYGSELAHAQQLNTSNDLIGPSIKQLLMNRYLEKSNALHVVNL